MDISCSICQEEFNSSSEISSTTCGHVFHTRCIQDWINRSSSCPECRQGPNPLKTLFLNFIDATQKQIEKITSLQTELEQTIKNASELENQLDEKKQNILDLEEELQIIKRDLEVQKKQKNCLDVQQKSRDHEILLKKIEISELTEELANVENIKEEQQVQIAIAKSKALSEEIKIKDCLIKNLEMKLRDKALELEKEIRNSTMLIYDKMKMQKLIDNFNETNPNCVDFYKKPEILFKTPEVTLNKNFNDVDRRKYSIRIDGFTEISSPLEEIIKYLGMSMGIYVNRYMADIKNVYILQHHKVAHKNLGKTLIVDFHKSDMKEKFLNNKEKLKLNPNTSALRISEYNVNFSELFAYAKKLNSIGIRVSLINNNVFYRRNGVSTQIINKQQVDDMLKENATINKKPEAPIGFKTAVNINNLNGKEAELATLCGILSLTDNLPNLEKDSACDELFYAL